MKYFSESDVLSHNQPGDCWVIIDSYVYDLSKFAAFHPGGASIIHKYGGKDASKIFFEQHDDDVLEKALKFRLGQLEGKSSKLEASKKSIQEQHLKNGTFGSIIPFAEPSWYRGYVSPYYNDSHRRWRAYVREFMDREVMPFVLQWNEQRKVPLNIRKKLADAGLLAGFIGRKWPTEYAPPIAPVLTPTEFDYFHQFILLHELSRSGSCGVIWGIMEGLQIGLPPLLHALKDDPSNTELAGIARECLAGDKAICLAITEPYAGSDVANIQCEAVLSPCGTYYTVTGEKKWITNGVFADYFTTAVRTNKGVAVVVVERGEGVTTKQMVCTGTWASGTTYVTFDKVRVPVSRVVGQPGPKGLKCIMENFNYERLGFAIQSNALARACVEDAFKWALKREMFGQRMIDMGVIRQKLSEMAAKVESVHSEIESVSFQMANSETSHRSLQLASSIALIKAHASKVLEFCASEAVQILGGRGYTRSGIGARVECISRDVKSFMIPAGSLETMYDIGSRYAVKAAKL